MWYSFKLPDDFWVNADGSGPDGQVLDTVSEDLSHLIEFADTIGLDEKTVTMLRGLRQELEEED